MREILLGLYAFTLIVCDGDTPVTVSHEPAVVSDVTAVRLSVQTELVEVDGVQVAVTEVTLVDRCLSRQVVALSDGIEFRGTDEYCVGSWGFVSSCANGIGCSRAYADKAGEDIVWEHDSPAYAAYEGHLFGATEHGRAADFFDRAVAGFLRRQGEQEDPHVDPPVDAPLISI
ncbi:MAG: hypothetical protein U9Q03_05920 [Patescibacteria group bacterium]|nr:hypothetical protein [Patescibacteria group bacterium]